MRRVSAGGRTARVDRRRLAAKHAFAGDSRGAGVTEADMTHDPALDAHEHREHAEHAAHGGDSFVSRVSITVAVLAVLAASAASLETVEASGAITASSEAVLAQDKATDAWNEYQADSLKRHVYGIAAATGGPHAAEFHSTAESQAARQTEIRKRAQEDEAERDHLMAASRLHERRHHWLTIAATLLEIGIAICTVAIVTRKRPFWLGSLVLGVAGAVVAAIAYLV
jgi:hypothetical protein